MNRFRTSRVVASTGMRLLLTVSLLTLLVQIPPATADRDSFDLFVPIESRADTSSPEALEAWREASVKKWVDAGVAEPAARALVAYEQAPSMKTAIGVLNHHKDFAGKHNLQNAPYSSTPHPQVFQTLDAAKYELILKCQQRLDGVDHAFRGGSTGGRFLEWVAWRNDPNRGLDDMPKLDPNKQHSSDDTSSTCRPRTRCRRTPWQPSSSTARPPAAPSRT